MCARFTLHSPGDLLTKLFELNEPPDFPARYNLAPTQDLLAVTEERDGRHARAMKWGLVPRWSKGGRKTLLINARGESAGEKPVFREAFARRRCLVPADGFFEWRQEGRTRQPYLIHLDRPEPFAIGAVYEPAEDGDHCVLLTTDANELIRPIHDRMPLIVPRESFADWLDPQRDAASVQPLVIPFPASRMRVDPVDPRVNDWRVDEPRLVEPLPPPLTLF